MEIEEFNVNKKNNNEIDKSNDHMEFLNLFYAFIFNC